LQSVRDGGGAALNHEGSPPAAQGAPEGAPDGAGGSKIPARIGRFRILRQLGRGATAHVYLAHDPRDDREVALKVIRFAGDGSEGEARAKAARRMRKLFVTEGAVAQRLDHPNIVKVYDTLVDENMALMAMEPVEGMTLAEYCSFDRLLPPHRVVAIIFKCCLALDYAYRQGVVHRDIKPANIMLTAGDQPKIMDFGLALNLQRDTDQNSTFVMGVGSPAYMSPEQVKGYTLNQQTDLYSLGVVLYMMLTGRAPFRAKHYPELIYKIVNSEPPLVSQLNPAVPTTFDPIVRKALEKDLYSRYRSGADFGKDLVAARYQLQEDDDGERYNARFDRLRRMPVFTEFERVELWEVLRIAQWLHVDQGTVLIQEGKEERTFGVLLEGEVEVSVNGHAIARLGAGEVLGEMAFLDARQKGRSATVLALTPCVYMEINPHAYELASDECRQHFQDLLVGALTRRLRDASARLAESAPEATPPRRLTRELELVPELDLDPPAGSHESAANSSFTGLRRSQALS
jgi:serine/threonine protein kinase